jgi:bacillithiol system protein YtxJ
MQFLALTPNISISQLIDQSFESPQLIFKHSTRCIISSFALKRLHACAHEESTCWVLDLLSHRQISNDLSDYFQVPHQSPQLFVVKDGILLGSTSHEGIDCEFIAACYEK